jgi:hypothetical protein
VELKEFIRQSLIDITAAVFEANAAYRQDRQGDREAFKLAAGLTSAGDKGIHFDIAVTTTTVRGANGKASAGIRVLGLEAGAEAHKSRENVSRIRFSVETIGDIG